MSWSPVAHGVGSSTDSNGFTTGSIDTTGCGFLIVGVVLGGGVSTGTLTDSKSNTWTALTQATGGFSDRFSQLFYCENPTVGSGHTFSISGTANFPSLFIAGFSGGATSSSFDVQNNNPGGVSSSVTTGSVTPSVDNELLVAMLNFDVTDTPTIDSGFTILDTINSGSFGHTNGQMAYLIETTATAKNPTFSWTNASRGMGVIATFKAAGGTPAATTPASSLLTMMGIG